MRSRINERSRHTTTHARRVAGMRRATRRREVAAQHVSEPVKTAGQAGGAAALWTAPESTCPLETSAVGTRHHRSRAVSAVPVDWSAVRATSTRSG